MSGYRDASNYEPFGTFGHRPARPFNAAQWTGVALVLFGIAADLAYFASALGWLRKPLGAPTLALVPLLVGVSLVNSRREGMVDPAPELAAARKRCLLITLAVCAAILGAALVIDLKGAL